MSRDIPVGSSVRDSSDTGTESIIPGHGPIEHDQQYLHFVTSLLESLTTQVHQAVTQGLTLEETQKKVNVETFRRVMTGDDQNLQRNFDAYFLQPGVMRAYREAKEGTLTEEN